MKKLLTFIAVVVLAASAQAQSLFNQTGNGTYDWNTSTNWANGIVPNAISAEAQFDYSTYVFTNNATIGVTISSPVTLGKIYIPSTAPVGSALMISGSPITFNMAGGGAPEIQHMVAPANVAVTIASDLVLADTDGFNMRAYNRLNITGNISGAGQFIRSGHKDYEVFLGGNNTFTGGIAIQLGMLQATTANAFVSTSGNLTFANMSGSGGISSSASGTTILANAINLGATSNATTSIIFSSGGTGNILNITTSSITGGNSSGQINISKPATEPSYGINFAGMGTVKFSGTDFTVANNVAGSNYNTSLLELSPASGTQTWTGNFTGFSGPQFNTDPTIKKSGAGTVVLAGANTYTSQTLVNVGTLLLNGTNIQAVNTYGDQSGLGNAANGRYMVENGATLGGTGRINVALANAAATANNAVLVKIGGNVAPGGASAIGTLTFDGASFTRNGTDDHVLNMAAESKFSFRLAGNGASADQVAFWNYVDGDLLLSGGNIAVNLTLSGAGDGLSHTVTLFKFYSDSGVTPFGAINISSGLALGSLDPNITGTPTFSYYSDRIDLTYIAAVPEPGTWVLLAFAGTILMAVRRRRQA